MTPKANSLTDHFGTEKQSNVQGPNGSSTNTTVPQGYAVGTGTYQSPADYTEVSRNQPLNEPEIDPLRNSPKLSKMVTSDSSNCVIELQPYYPSCNFLVSCEACQASVNCGWELHSAKCQPGNPAGPACPMFGSIWKHRTGCPNGPTSGHLTNVAPEHTGNVQPEHRTKLGASGSWWKEVDPAGHVRVVSGDFSNLAAEASSLITPKQRNAPNDTEVPDSWDPNVPDGKHVVSGQISNLAPYAKDLISPAAPNVFNVGLTQPHIDQVLTHVFLQQKEKTMLHKAPSDDDIKQSERNNENRMESFVNDMIENMPKSNGDADSLDEIKNKFDQFSESLNRLKSSLHLDDETLKSKLENNTQFKTLLKDNNVKMDPSVNEFKDKMDKELAADAKVTEEENKEMVEEAKEQGVPTDKEETPAETMKEAQRQEDLIEDGSVADKDGDFKMNDEEANKIAKEMEKASTSLKDFADKDPSLEDIKSGKLDKDTQKITDEMSKGAEGLEDKDLQIDDLQKLTAKADKELEEQEKMGKKDTKEDANNLAELDDLTKIDDVGVENMNVPRFKQKKVHKTVQKTASPAQVQPIVEGPADELLRQREKEWDKDDDSSTPKENIKNIDVKMLPKRDKHTK